MSTQRNFDVLMPLPLGFSHILHKEPNISKLPCRLLSITLQRHKKDPTKYLRWGFFAKTVNG